MKTNDVIQKLNIKASGLLAKRESIPKMYNFNNFLLKYNLENKATSNIKIQDVLKKIKPL